MMVDPISPSEQQRAAMSSANMSSAKSPRTLPPIATESSTMERPMNKPRSAPSLEQPKDFSSLPFWFGLLFSVLWVAVVGFVLLQAGHTQVFVGIPTVNWAIGISAVVSPVALIWMVAAYLQRASDIQSVTAPLAAQLAAINGETGQADTRIRRFNQAIKEQLELLKSTRTLSQQDLQTMMERVRQHKNDLDSLARRSVEQVGEIQAMVRASTQHIEQVMEDKFTMLRVLENKMTQSGDGVARQVEGVRDQISSMLENIHAEGEHIADALQRAERDTRKMTDAAREQENSLALSAQSISEILSTISDKIDVDVAGFVGRLTEARQESEQLTSTLATQAKSLDEFSGTLPSRVQEAEVVLRAVSDRLRASEQAAREQAIQLGERLTIQVDGLHALLNRLGTQLSDVDSGFQKRRDDFDDLVGRIATASEDLSLQLHNSMRGLDDRAQTSLQKFVAVNEQARVGADVIGTHLAETAGRYENAATRLEAISRESSDNIKTLNAEIGLYAERFADVNAQSMVVGREVQKRAEAAMENMTSLITRLEATREATDHVGETLVGKMHEAISNNEQLIARITEASQMSVSSLAVATDALARQETNMSGQTRATEALLREAVVDIETHAVNAERTLRTQTQNLNLLLELTQQKISETDKRLQVFAAEAVSPISVAINKIDEATVDGMGSLQRYGEGLSTEIQRLQNFNTRVVDISSQLGSMTNQTLATMENIHHRFEALQTTQQETVEQTLMQFNAVADRVQKEVSGIADTGGMVREDLRLAAEKIGEQSQKMVLDAEKSSQQLQSVSGTLQNEAGQIRTILQKHAGDLNAELARAESQFIQQGDSLKQRTDYALQLLNDVARRHDEVARESAMIFDERTERLKSAAEAAHSKADALSSTLLQQLGLIGTGAEQISIQSETITNETQKTVQSLTSLQDRMQAVREVTAATADFSLGKLDEVANSLQRQNNALQDNTQTMQNSLHKATSLLGEQATKMLDNTYQTEQQIRTLAATSTTLSDQANQMRLTTEQHNQRLLSSLNDLMAGLELTTSKLQSTVTTAMQNTDQIHNRLGDVTEIATNRLNTTHQTLKNVAESAEQTLQQFDQGLNAKIMLVGTASEKLLNEHEKIMAAEDARATSLTGLFDRLTAAEQNAEQTAERASLRIEEAGNALDQQMGRISDQAQSALASLRTTGAGFGEQTAMIMQYIQQAEQQTRNMMAATTAMQDHGKDLKATIEAQCQGILDNLGALHGKLSANTSDIRHLSQETEQNIATIGAAASAQIANLIENTENIAARHRQLAAAADGQRETLGALLARLNVANDETAAMGERTANRMHEASESIMRNVLHLDEQANLSLNAVRATGSAFADQAGQLLTFAGDAEQKVRNLVSGMGTFKNEAEKMHNDMHDQTVRAATQLGTILANMEQAHDRLATTATKSQAMVSDATNLLQGNLHATEDKFREITNQLKNLVETASENTAGMLAEKAESLANIVSDAEVRLTQVGQFIDNRKTSLIAVSEEIGMTSGRLNLLTEQLLAELMSLRNEMGQENHIAKETVGQMVTTLSAAREEMRRELLTLSSEAQKTTDHIGNASKTLSIETNGIRQELQHAEVKLAQVTGAIREQTKDIPDTFDRAIIHAENATGNLKQQTEVLGSLLESASHKFTSLVGTVRNQIVEDARNLDHVVDGADQSLRRFNKSIVENIANINLGMTQVSGDSQQIVGHANKAAQQIIEACERLSRVRGETQISTEQMVREFDAMENRMGSAHSKITKANEGVIVQMSEYLQVAQKVESQLMVSSATFREQLEKMRGATQLQIDDINRGLLQITAQLERTGNTIRNTTGGTVVDLDKIAARFQNISGGVAQNVTEQADKLKRATEEAAQLLVGFGDQFDAMLDRMAMAGDGIKRYEGTMSQELSGMLSLLGNLNERLDSSRVMTNTVTEQALVRLSEVAKLIEKQMVSLADGSQTAVGIVRNAGESYARQAEDLQKIIGQTKAHFEELTERGDFVRTNLKNQGQDLVRSLADIMTQIESVGESIQQIDPSKIVKKSS
jgi:hypothetical protein